MVLPCSSVDILVQEAEAEDAERGWIGLELLYDQIVVLTCLDIGAILADGLAGGLLGVGVERLDLGELLAGSIHDELDECVAGAGGGRRTQDLDLLGWQGRIDLAPGHVGVGDELAIDWHVLGQSQPDLLLAEREGLVLLAVRKDDAVEPDLDLGDLLHAGLGAGLDLGLLDLARGISDVGGILADAGAEQLDPAAGAGALHHGRLQARLLSELLGDRRGEREHGRRADDADLVTRLGLRGDGHERSRGRGHAEDDA